MMQSKKSVLATVLLLAMTWTAVAKADPQSDAASAYYNMFDTYSYMCGSPGPYTYEECMHAQFYQAAYDASTANNYFQWITSYSGWWWNGCVEYEYDCSYISYAAAFYPYLLAYLFTALEVWP